MLTEEQIQAMVMVKYPKEDKERNCKQHKLIMQDKREWYAEQLRSNKIEHPTLN